MTDPANSNYFFLDSLVNIHLPKRTDDPIHHTLESSALCFAFYFRNRATAGGVMRAFG